jgi:hypothetical protein
VRAELAFKIKCIIIPPPHTLIEGVRKTRLALSIMPDIGL